MDPNESVSEHRVVEMVHGVGQDELLERVVLGRGPRRVHELVLVDARAAVKLVEVEHVVLAVEVAHRPAQVRLGLSEQNGLKLGQ